VLKLLKEPCAAALAYGLKADIKNNSHILVYDLGGGTFDVSIMTVGVKEFRVQAYDGDTMLGGVDFDNKLVAYMAKIIKDKHNYDVFSSDVELHMKNKEIRSVLKTACELAKRQLSTAPTATIRIGSLLPGVDIAEKVTRFMFEQFCEDLFNRTIELVDRALKTANMTPTDIGEVVMVGGSTRIPKIKELVKKKFGATPLCESINPDEAVAYGAAIQAAMLSASDHDSENARQLRDITPHDLSIGVTNGEVSVVINRGTRIPHRAKKVFVTADDYQTAVIVEVYEVDQTAKLASKFP